MTDEFDSIMAEGGLDPSTFVSEDDRLGTHGILPPGVDNHTAVHLLEAELQLTAFLYAQDFVLGFIGPDVPDLDQALKVGLAQYGADYRQSRGASPLSAETVGDPTDIEFVAWVRVAAGQLALALEGFIAGHGLDRITVMVHLSGHGWYPFTMGSGFGREVPGLGGL